MTDAVASHAPPRPRAVLLGTLAVFAAVLLFLVGQMRAGHDPVLRLFRPAAVHRRVIVRRIYERVIVVRRAGTRLGAARTSISSSSTTGGGGYTAAPSTHSS